MRMLHKLLSHKLARTVACIVKDNRPNAFALIRSRPVLERKASGPTSRAIPARPVAGPEMPQISRRLTSPRSSNVCRAFL